MSVLSAAEIERLRNVRLAQFDQTFQAYSAASGVDAWGEPSGGGALGSSQACRTASVRDEEKPEAVRRLRESVRLLFAAHDCSLSFGDRIKIGADDWRVVHIHEGSGPRLQFRAMIARETADGD